MEQQLISTDVKKYQDGTFSVSSHLRFNLSNTSENANKTVCCFTLEERACTRLLTTQTDKKGITESNIQLIV